MIIEKIIMLLLASVVIAISTTTTTTAVAAAASIFNTNSDDDYISLISSSSRSSSIDNVPFLHNNYDSNQDVITSYDDDNDDNYVSQSRARIVIGDGLWKQEQLLELGGEENENSSSRDIFDLQSSSSSSSSLQLSWSPPPPSDISQQQHIQQRRRRQQSRSRNDEIKNNNMIKDKLKKTGTTIVGLIVNGTVILGSDSRATSGSIVADKECFKLHTLASNCVAAGAGTSADLDHITRECYYQTKLWNIYNNNNENYYNDRDVNDSNHNDNIEQPVPVLTICKFLQEKLKSGSQANLIVGGVYDGVSYLRAIHPYGSMDVIQYTALGSGSLAAMSILENEYNTIRNVQDGINLVIDAVKAGIDHDLGSGSQVDICIITPHDGGISKFTRKILPDEKLVTEKIKQQREDYFIGGVNGFGNVPYIIKSKRIIQSSQNEIERNKKQLWNDIIK